MSFEILTKASETNHPLGFLLQPGLDPMPWVLATLGMVCMILRADPPKDKTKNQIRRHALANGLISLICGGLGGPWVSVIIGKYFDRDLVSPLLMAFLISAFWQVITLHIWPIFLQYIQNRVSK